MKVKCIDVDTNRLTNGKVYDVLGEDIDGKLGEDTGFYLIKDDLGETRWSLKIRFEICDGELFPIF